MMLICLSLVFCCICGCMSAYFLTAQHRALNKDIRLRKAHCVMLDALKELDERIWAKNIPSTSLIVEFQHFAWNVKDRDEVFTAKSFMSIFFYDMAMFAAAAEVRNNVTREMSQVPRLNHCKDQFLQGYYQLIEYQHPIMANMLGMKNRWMLRRYNQLSIQRRKELAALHRDRISGKRSPLNLANMPKWGPLQGLPFFCHA